MEAGSGLLGSFGELGATREAKSQPGRICIISWPLLVVTHNERSAERGQATSGQGHLNGACLPSRLRRLAGFCLGAASN